MITIDPVATVARLAVIALGLAAGAMLAEATVLVPYWRSMPPASFLAWYAANASRLFGFFAPMEIGSTLLAVVTAAIYRAQRRPGAAAFASAALLALAVLIAFPLYFQEANASFAAGRLPHVRVAAELSRWAWWHWIRTVIGVGAFAAAVVGASGHRSSPAAGPPGGRPGSAATTHRPGTAIERPFGNP